MTLQQTFERGLMEGDVDAFDFVLAEKLGKTLAEIGAMSNREHTAWRAFYVYRKAMQEME